MASIVSSFQRKELADEVIYIRKIITIVHQWYGKKVDVCILSVHLYQFNSASMIRIFD